jgi:hypothetical protein
MKKLSIIYCCILVLKIFMLSYHGNINIDFISGDAFQLAFWGSVFGDIVLSIIILFKLRTTKRRLVFGFCVWRYSAVNNNSF